MTAMPPPNDQTAATSIESEYTAALTAYVTGGDEFDLANAYDCARMALSGGISIGELGDIHFRTAQALIDMSPEAKARSEAFFLEAISVYDMALRGYGESVKRLTGEIKERQRVERDLREATEALSKQRDALDQTVKDRTRELQERLEDLRRVNIQLQQTNTEQSQFTYAISHDLKSPVNTVAMMLDLLECDELDEDSRELVDAARATTARMRGLIQDVLDYSRLVGQEPHFEQVDLAELCAEVLDDLRAEISGSAAEVEISDLPQVRGNPGQLRSLFQNLISNAIKFRRPCTPPRITVRATEKPQGVGAEILFCDNGIGIGEAYLTRIFGLFQRLHTYEEYAGSGIGLTLCQRIVGYHHGDICVRSTTGEGSCFVVRLWVEEGETHDGSQTCDDRG